MRKTIKIELKSFYCVRDNVDLFKIIHPLKKLL